MNNRRSKNRLVLRLFALSFIGFTAVALLPVVISGWLNKPTLAERFAAYEPQRLLAEQIAVALRRYADDAAAVFRFVVVQGSADGQFDELRELARSVHIRDVLISGRDGHILGTSGNSDTLLAEQLPAAVVSGVHAALSRTDTLLQVVFSALLPDLEGRASIYLVMPLPQGRLALGMLSADFFQSLQSMTKGRNGYVMVVDQNSRVLSHPDPERLGDKIDIAALSAVEQTDSVWYAPWFGQTASQGAISGYAALDGLGWEVLVVQPPSLLRSLAAQRLRQALFALAAGLAIALLASGLFTHFLKRRLAVMQPLAEALQVAPATQYAADSAVTADIRHTADSAVTAGIRPEAPAAKDDSDAEHENPAGYLRLQRALQDFHRANAAYHPSFALYVEALLKVGCRHLDVPIGVLGRIQGDQYQIVHCAASQDDLHPGMSFTLNQQSISLEAFEASEVVDYELPVDASNPFEQSYHHCFPERKLRRYLGIALYTERERYGVLEFLSLDSSQVSFPKVDHVLLQLMAQWLMNELLKRRAARSAAKR